MAQFVYPKIKATIISEGGNPALQSQRILIIGPKDENVGQGTGEASIIYENINLSSAYTLFGKKSILSSAIKSMFDVLKQTGGSTNVPQIDAMCLFESVGSVASSSTVTFTGTATANGSITFYIGSYLNHKYTISFETGSTALDLATLLSGAINGDQYAPFSAALSSSGPSEIVTITCVHKGEVGNKMTMIKTGENLGFSCVTAGFSGGTLNPSTTNAFVNAQNIRYQHIVSPSQWGRKYINDFLFPRFNTNQNSIMDGESIICINDTFANAKTFAVSGDSVSNSQVMVTIGNKYINQTNFESGAIPELDLVIGAQVGIINALRLTQNSNLNNFIIANLIGTTDAIGGAALASLPLFNTRGLILPTINPEYEFTNEEIDEAEENCLTLLGNSPNRQYIQYGEMVTSYRYDTFGFPDTTFKYLNYIYTYSVIREFFRNTLISLYGQARLVNSGGSTGGGRSVASEETIRADLISIYTTLASNDYLLTQGDIDSLNEFKTSILISRDQTNRGFNISMFVPIVGQLEQLNITFIFNTNV